MLMFGFSNIYQTKAICLFDYLNSIYWTRCIIGTVLVHQRAVGKNHSMPQIDVGFTKGHVQEHLQKRDRHLDIWRVSFSICKHNYFSISSL